MLFKKKHTKLQMEGLIEEVDCVNRKVENMKLSKNLDDKIKESRKHLYDNLDMYKSISQLDDSIISYDSKLNDRF